MEKKKPGKLWSKAYHALLEQIRGMRAGDNRLPPEEDIAASLQISRATVREAMQVLLSEGFVTRRQGKGNFAHPSVFSLNSRIDLTPDFLRLLSTQEQPAMRKFLSCGYGPASEAMRARWPVPCDQAYQQH